MHELEIDIGQLQHILTGQKTVEGLLGKPEYLKIRVGDHIQFHDAAAENIALATVKQLLYFESFEEMLHAVSFYNVMPEAETIDDALKAYKKLYSAQDEHEYGVVAVTFALDQ